LKVYLLRANRKMVAMTFSLVVVPLHVVLIGIMLFITEAVQVFGTQLTGVQAQSLDSDIVAEAGVGNVMLFQPPALDFIPVFVGTVVLLLTAANSFAPYAASGGHRLKLCLYGAIMMVISGVLLMTVPSMVQALFQSISSTPVTGAPVS